MTAENANYIPELVPANPGPTDFVSFGEDHLTLIKQVLQNQFSQVPTGPVINAWQSSRRQASVAVRRHSTT